METQPQISVAELSLCLQDWERHCAPEKTKFIKIWIEKKRAQEEYKKSCVGYCEICDERKQTLNCEGVCSDCE